MRLQHDIKPIADLDQSTAQLVRTAAEERRTFLFTDDSGARAVLMDAASYDRWRNTAALLQMIAQSEAEVAQGKVVPQDEAFARAGRACRSPLSPQGEVTEMLERAARTDVDRFREKAAELRRRLAGRSFTDSGALIAEDRAR